MSWWCVSQFDNFVMSYSCMSSKSAILVSTLTFEQINSLK